MKKLDYNKIEKLTSIGHYNVDIPLGYLKNKIDNFVKEYDLEMNPDFQRGHVWTPKQRILFIEFIIKGGETTKIFFNHPNWMSSSTYDGDFVCVDGLQRITAVLMFLDNKVPVFGGYYLKDIKNSDIMLRGINIRFNINNLKTRKEVLNWYLEMNSGGTPHTDAELKKVKKLLTNIK